MDGGLNGQPTGQHSNLTVGGARAGLVDENDSSGAAVAALRFAVLILLVVDGVFCAAATALFLPSYIGPHPFPISALIAGLVNGALVWVGLHWTESLRVAALPMWAWLLTVAAMALGGPGDDLIFAGHGVMAYGMPVLIVLGSAPPGLLLWRRWWQPPSREQA